MILLFPVEVTKWASTLSLRSRVSLVSNLVPKFTGYNPASALEGLCSPWKGSVEKAGVQKDIYCSLKSMLNCNEKRPSKARSWITNIFPLNTAKDIMRGCQEYEYVPANQWINWKLYFSIFIRLWDCYHLWLEIKTTSRNRTKFCLHFMGISSSEEF